VRALSDRSRNAALRTVFRRGGKKWFLEYSKGNRQYRNQAGAKSDVLPGEVLVRLIRLDGDQRQIGTRDYTPKGSRHRPTERIMEHNSKR